MNGVIEDATGDLIRAGFTDFTAGAGETVRNDVPEPAFIRDGNAPNFHSWTGSDWTTKAQLTILYGRYKVTEYVSNNVVAIRLYATDNGDDTYNDLVEEYVFTYDGNRLASKVYNKYFNDGTVAKTRTWNYYRRGSDTIEKEV